ncbi:hypothetical protein [Guggenheimella bovis]
MKGNPNPLLKLLKALREEPVEFEARKKRLELSPWIILLITAGIMFIYYFFELPALNFFDFGFYRLLIVALIVFNVLNLLIGQKKAFLGGVSGILMIVFLVLPFVLSFFSSPFFHAKSYSKLITVENGDFAKDVTRIEMSQIPVVDRSAASVIGERQMGNMGELVSQFTIDDNYAQVNLKGKPIRVTPLKYYDLIKYLFNYRNGIPYYVSIDMTTQAGSMVKLEKPIFFSKSDILLRNINRHLRFQYPFTMFGETNFEVDDSGNPYFITSIIEKKIALFGGQDVKGAIITDANSGESKRYELKDVPTWVDRVYPSDMIITQLDDRGTFAGGFINSIFGQKNVTHTTEGYNYVSIGDDIYLVTGVTSARSDQSNLGFYYVNLRTKEAKFYPCASATELSAMESAQGKVQEKDYMASFPVLLNLANRPVYFMGLKDATEIAKMFAIVDAQRFDTVYTGNTPAEAVNNYLNSNSTSGQVTSESKEKTITIHTIQEVVIDGNTTYFITAKEDELVYTVTGKKIGIQVVKLKEGARLKVVGNESEKHFEILNVLD